MELPRCNAGPRPLPRRCPSIRKRAAQVPFGGYPSEDAREGPASDDALSRRISSGHSTSYHHQPSAPRGGRDPTPVAPIRGPFPADPSATRPACARNRPAGHPPSRRPGPAGTPFGPGRAVPLGPGGLFPSGAVKDSAAPSRRAHVAKPAGPDAVRRRSGRSPSPAPGPLCFSRGVQGDSRGRAQAADESEGLTSVGCSRHPAIKPG